MVGPPSGSIARRADMFESMEDAGKKGSGRTMKIIWILLAVVAVILAIVSFA
jgi:flagellar basal body-associated protein FliL